MTFDHSFEHFAAHNGVHWGLVSHRADAAQPFLSSGAAAQLSLRVPFRALVAAEAVRLVYANRQLLSSGETAPADAWTLKAALEAPNGDVHPLYFGGKREPVLAPGDEVVSDPVLIDLRPGDDFFVRSRPRVDAVGQRWPIGGGGVGGGGDGGGIAPGDVVDTAGPGAFGKGGMPFGPVAVLGASRGAPRVSAVVLGSSTAYGNNDTNYPDTGELGFLARALFAAGVPHFRLAAPGLTFAGALGAEGADPDARTAYHRSLVARCRPTHAVVSLGNNDVSNAGTALEANQRGMLRYLDFVAGGLGLPAVVCTVTPRTTSTDGFSTVENQAGHPAHGKRLLFNEWLRGRPHPAIVDVWDVAAVVEAPGDRSKTRVDGGAWSADGIHLGAVGHAGVGRALAGPAAGLAARKVAPKLSRLDAALGMLRRFHHDSANGARVRGDDLARVIRALEEQ